MEDAKNGHITKVGDRSIASTENIDGYKFFFENGEWLMIRASGTEPVLRFYGQSTDKEATRRLLDDAFNQLIKNNTSD